MMQTPRIAISQLVDESIATAKERISFYSRCRWTIGVCLVLASAAATITSGAALGVQNAQGLQVASCAAAGISTLVAGMQHMFNAEHRLSLYRHSLVKLQAIRVTLADELTHNEFVQVRHEYENAAMAMSRISDDGNAAPTTPRPSVQLEAIHVPAADGEPSPAHLDDAH